MLSRVIYSVWETLEWVSSRTDVRLTHWLHKFILVWPHQVNDQVNEIFVFGASSVITALVISRHNTRVIGHSHILVQNQTIPSYIETPIWGREHFFNFVIKLTAPKIRYRTTLQRELRDSSFSLSVIIYACLGHSLRLRTNSKSTFRVTSDHWLMLHSRANIWLHISDLSLSRPVSET